MSLIYYLIDDTADWIIPYTARLPQYAGHTSRRVKVRVFEPIEHVVSKVRGTLAKGEKIRWLYLCAHGDTGLLGLGEGLYAENAHTLRPLRQSLESTSNILIHGCGVASDTSVVRPGSTPQNRAVRAGTYKPGGRGEGYRFLRAVAKATGVPASGAINAQYGDYSFYYEGAFVTVWPNGAESVTQGRG